MTGVTLLPALSQATPPPEKRLKLEESVNAESANIKNQSEKSAKPVPLKEAHLKLDDIPPELLRKHQERIKKQACETSVLCTKLISWNCPVYKINIIEFME